MAKITLGQAARWCGGEIDPGYAEISFFGADDDAGTIGPGQLYVALAGEKGIPEAMGRGAAAVLCTRCDGSYPAIVVPDVRIALGEIAQNERMRIGMKVVGIMGAVGKNTTKEMTACLLQTTYRVGKTPMNQNDDIGLPMAILAMPEDTQVAVLAMGMSHLGDISFLTSMLRPDVTVILNIGTMHIEHLGSMEGILQARLEVLDSMPENSRIILNGDDSMLLHAQHALQIQPIYFGVSNTACDVCATDIREEANGLSFRVKSARGEYPVTLALEGRHYVPDALAAIAVAMELGVSPENIRQSLAKFITLAGRTEFTTRQGVTVIQDWYSAGPGSVATALTVLGSKPGRRVAVLGDMIDLGSCSQAEHYRIGRIAAENADLVLAYGPNASRMISGAYTGGMSPTRTRAFDDPEKLVAALKRLAKPGDVILFKGGQQMHMELVLKKFLQDEE